MKKEEINMYYSNVPNQTAELLRTKRLLDEHKAHQPKQKTIQISEKLSIEVDARLTKEQINDKVRKWRDKVQQIVSANDLDLRNSQ